VICRGDRKDDGSKGDYELATHKAWKSKHIAQKYADGCNYSREPIVVTCYGGLNFRIED
jgi:hypothetical protein